MTDLKKIIRDGNIIIGKDVVLKKLRAGEISQVFVVKNCPTDVLAELNHMKSISEFDLVQTEYTNRELGVLCKKPFSIAIIGIPKA